RILRERELDPAQVAYVGNDVNDVECLGLVGVPICVADAWPAALRAARYVTARRGGGGAVREVCDLVLGQEPAP
ncbi:MAG: HAD hydrolase family protein, partial [Acidobacteria bacterium]|nr:HAD hydrolase family protein [Acidobacteriota bacterium]